MFDNKHDLRKKVIQEYYFNLPNYPKIDNGISGVYDHLAKVWELMRQNDCLPNMSIEQFVQEVQNCQMNTLMEMEMMKGMTKPPMEKIKCEVKK